MGPMDLARLSDDDLLAAAPRPPGGVRRALGDARVEQLLERLTPEQARAVRARVIAGEPYPQIATTLRCSESVLRQRVSRGLAVLRQLNEAAQ
jgi:DNA-directed RNA polymerase specialized sigma24 family protein